MHLPAEGYSLLFFYVDTARYGKIASINEHTRDLSHECVELRFGKVQDM